MLEGADTGFFYGVLNFLLLKIAEPELLVGWLLFLRRFPGTPIPRPKGRFPLFLARSADSYSGFFGPQTSWSKRIPSSTPFPQPLRCVGAEPPGVQKSWWVCALKPGLPPTQKLLPALPGTFNHTYLALLLNDTYLTMLGPRHPPPSMQYPKGPV